MKEFLKDLSKMNKNLPINPDDELVKTPVLGKLYHLSWASKRGMVWKLHSIVGDKANMVTPKTNKMLTTNLNDLRETNASIINKAKKRYNERN